MRRRLKRRTDEFDRVATELALAAGWSAPNGLFIAGDLAHFWDAAMKDNPTDPVAALRAFPVWRGATT